MASVYEMQSLVNEQRAIQSRLRQELYALESGVSNAANRWNELTNHINNTLVNGHNRIVNSHDLTLKAYELQCDIERIYKLYKYVESANKKIRELQNKVYYDFANYNAVRKIVESMLNNIEISFVSDSVLTKAIEIKHLQLPDYWLTCALLSIMAWRNDDRVMAEKALERACMLDKKNSCIFFFAFHMRIGKNAVALKWFRNYISCDLTGQDNVNVLFMFSLLSKSVETEYDDKIYAEVNDFVNRTIKARMESEGYSEEAMTKRISGYLKKMMIREPLKYPVLSKYCKESRFYADILSAVKNNSNILEFVRKTVNLTTTEKINRLNQFIDDIIRRSNTSEVNVKNEIYHNELIIKYMGEKEKADKEYEEWLEHNRTELDIISEMIEWVYNPGDTDVNAAEKQRLFVMISDLTKKAVDNNVNEYRNSFRKNADIQIEEYSSYADLTNEGAEHQKIDVYYRQKAEALIAQQKIWPSFLWFGAGVLCGVLAVVFGLFSLFVGTAIGAVGGAGQILLTNRRKKNIAKNCAREAVGTKEIFSRMSAEFRQYLEEYSEYDKYYEVINDDFSRI